MKYLLLLVILNIAGCGLLSSDTVDPVEYNEIVGSVWALSHELVKHNGDNGVYYDFSEFWTFDKWGNVKGYVEKYNYNNDGTTSGYQFTDRYIGNVYLIDIGHYRSAAADLNIVNMSWQQVIGVEESKFGHSIIMNIALISMSEDGDTLEVGFCSSDNCYVDQYGAPDECYGSFGTLIRYDKLEERKAWWKYY